MTKPAPVKVTVLMTLFNKGAYVGEAVESVLNNSFQDLELLIVDDASTDNGPEVVRAFKDPRIRMIVNEKNLGRPAAANRGYDNATGKYIAVLDADDIAHPDRIATQYDHMEADPEIGALGGYAQAFGASDVLYAWPEIDATSRALMLFGVPLCYGAAMLRRSVIEQHHIRCDVEWRRPGMDYLFLLKVSQHTKLANLRSTMIHYRIGEQNMRHGRDPLRDTIELDREVFRLLGLSITEPELHLHYYLHGADVDGLSKDKVKALALWLDDLKAQNRAKNLFPPELFEAELAMRWSRLFKPLIDSDALAAYAHVAVTKEGKLGKASYLGKRLLKRLVDGRNG